MPVKFANSGQGVDPVKDLTSMISHMLIKQQSFDIQNYPEIITWNDSN